MAVFNIFRREKRPALISKRASGADTAIIFIHGFQGHVEKTWDSFVVRILDERSLRSWDVYLYGYSSRFWFDIPNVWSADAPLIRLSLGLRATLGARPLSSYKAVAVVGHSMGGLIIQHAVLDLDTAARIGLVALYGTPSNGLRKTMAGRWFKRQFRDMHEESSFIHDLRAAWQARFKTEPGDEPPNLPFAFFVAAGENDEFVPPSSSLEPFHDRFRRVVPGNHLSMIRAAAPKEHAAACQLLVDTLTSGAAAAGPLDSARVAVQTREFHKAVGLFESHPEKLDSSALVQYALALDGVGRRGDAIKELRRSGLSSTDAMGTLAGRFKRLWRLERKAEDADEALRLYQIAYKLAQKATPELPGQLFYLAINVAYFACVYSQDLQGARGWASTTLMHCESAKDDPREELWRLATEGEAKLLLGRKKEATRRYRQFLSKEPRPWQVSSAFDQAFDLCESLSYSDLRRQLERLLETEDLFSTE